MKNTLKQYQTIKSPLLKEWAEENFERHFRHVLHVIEANLKHNIIIEHGHTQTHIDYDSLRELEGVFGLPYTSSSDFAAVWNTNTQTVAKYGKRLYFRGAAIAENLQTALIFHDEKENYFYFYEYDFLHYQDHERRRAKAKYWGEFVKKSNIIKNKCIDILKSYEGKPYGQKTAEKIGQELDQEAKKLGLKSVWLKSSQYGEGLEIYGDFNAKNRYYFEYLTNENKIKEPADRMGQPIPDDEECDTLAEFEKAGELVDKMKKKAGELLAMVEEFKKHASRANYYPKETQSIYSVDLQALANGRIQWGGLKMISEKFLKIGQLFEGKIDGSIIQIIDISKGLKDTAKQSPTQQKTIYIYVKDTSGRISHTNKEHFKKLLFKPIKGGSNNE